MRIGSLRMWRPSIAPRGPGPKKKAAAEAADLWGSVLGVLEGKDGEWWLDPGVGVRMVSPSGIQPHGCFVRVLITQLFLSATVNATKGSIQRT